MRNSDISQISCFGFCKPTGALEKVLFNTCQENSKKQLIELNFLSHFFTNNFIPSDTANYNLCGRSLPNSVKCLSFPSMNNPTSVSSSTSIFNCKTTSIIEVASSSGILRVFHLFHQWLDSERAVIPRTEDRLKRIEESIARLGETLESFISSSFFRRTNEVSRGYQTDLSVNTSHSEIDMNSTDERHNINALLPKVSKSSQNTRGSESSK